MGTLIFYSSLARSLARSLACLLACSLARLHTLTPLAAPLAARPFAPFRACLINNNNSKAPIIDFVDYSLGGDITYLSLGLIAVGALVAFPVGMIRS